jgi:molybdenum cofactor biosynthesis enzyme
MLKRYEQGMVLETVELLEKRGGRTGTWRAAPRRVRRART